MKQFLTIIFFGYLLLSCKKEYQSRTITKIDIEEFKMDSTSIRAIEVIDKNNVFYVGSNGDYGFISTNKKPTTSFNQITYKDSIVPHFRSLATNGKDFFFLSIGNPALLYKYSDGKTTLIYTENHEKVFYDSMKFFPDKKHGIAIGDPTNGCPSVILTSDSGNSWVKIPCESLPKFEEGEAFFAASNTNIAIVNSTVWVASGGKKSRILKSVDMGKTWQIFKTPFIQGNGPQGMYSIDFFDEQNGIAIGGDYSKPTDNCKNKAITKDGGKTWTIVSDNINPNYKSCVQYVPNTNGKEVFAVGKTGISFSNDGGKTWKQVSEESYYSIQFADKNTAWLSGNRKIGNLSI